MSKQTYEGKAKTKNGIKRMISCGISIILEFVFLFILMTKLYDYADFVAGFVRVMAVLLVLGIYSQYKTSTMKMPWIILILAVPIVGVTLYLLVGLSGGTRKMRKRYEEIDNELLPRLQTDDSHVNELTASCPKAGNISKYITDYTRYPLYKNTDVTYYDEASKGLEAQLEDMTKAKRFIFMEYHAIEDGESFSRIESVLEAKVREGIEVRVFYDDLGSIGFVNMDFAKKLMKKGINCRVFNPVMPGINFFLNNRDHRKITVIDGKIAYTGGYNLADEYFNITNPYGKWKDTGIRIEGDAVKSLTATFLEMWNAMDLKPSKNAKDNPVEVCKIDCDKYMVENDYIATETGFVQPYADSPLDGEQVGESVYISIINKAERYCWFMTPYLIITDEMAHALSLASKRGVDVRIVTPGIPDKRMIYSVTRSFYSGLVKDGVRIYEWEPGFCHAKMSIADDCMATCGTINLDYRSLYHHFENGCFMVNCDAIIDMKADFIKTFDECREVTEKYRTGRGATLRLRQLLLRLFAELL